MASFQQKNNLLGGLNLDLSNLRIPPNYAVFIKNMTDSVNLNSGAPGGAGSDSAVKTPIEGCQALSITGLPSGENIGIGFYDSEQSNEGYFALWNSTGNHSIWVISGTDGSVNKVLEDTLLPFDLNPEHFLAEGRMTLELISTIDPPTGNETNYKLLIFTNNNGQQYLIDVTASGATNGYRTTYFTSSASHYNRLELFHLGAKTPINTIGLNTPVAYTTTVADASLQNLLINADWQFRIRTWDVWGRPSDWGIISNVYITLIGSGCIATSNGLPRCVNINFDAGNPLVKYITLGYRRGVGNDPTGEIETGWMEYETFNKYNDSTGAEWYQRPINPLFTTSGSGITFNASTNIITYTFCADKGNIPVDPQEAARTQPGIPILSSGVNSIEKKILLANNAYDFQPVLQTITDQIAFSVALPTTIPCDAAPTRTIIFYATLYDPFLDEFPFLAKDNGLYVFGGAFTSTPPSDTNCGKSGPFKLGQVFADQVNPGFIAYLAGTNHKVVGQYGVLDTATGTFTPNSLPWPVLTATGTPCTQFTFVDIPASKYVIRLASHHATVNDSNLQLTSTQVWGVCQVQDPDTSFGVRNRCFSNPVKEIEIDCTSANVVLSSPTSPMFAIMDLTSNIGTTIAIDGYLYEQAGGVPIEMAVVTLDATTLGVAPPGNAFGSFFTDHNGYYFITGKLAATSTSIFVDYCDGSGPRIVFTIGNACGIIHNYGTGPAVPNYFGNFGSWASQIYAAGPLAPVEPPFSPFARRVIKQPITICGSSTEGVPGIPVVLTKCQPAITDNNGLATLIAHNRYNYITVLTTAGFALPLGATSLPDYSTSPNNQDSLVFSQNGGCQWNVCGTCGTSMADVVVAYIGCGGSTSGCSPNSAIGTDDLIFGGINFVAGNLFNVNGGSPDATGQVTGVGIGGVVTSYVLLTFGDGYTTTAYSTTATTGIGSGLTILVTSINPPPRSTCLTLIHVSANGVGIFGLQDGGKYPVGYVLSDVISRHTGVQIKQGQLGYVSVPNLNDINPPYPTQALCSLQVTIPSSLNVGTEFYNITFCVGQNVLFSDYISWAADWVQFVDNTGTENITNPTAIRIYYSSLNEYNKQYNFTTNTAWDIIDKETSQTYPSDIVQFLINGDGTYFPSVIAASVSYNKNGVFFTVPYQAGLANLINGCLFKIIRPRSNKTGENLPYWEQCLTLPIVGGVLPAGTYTIPYFDNYLISRFIPVPIMAAVINTNIPGTSNVVPVIDGVSQVGGGVQAIALNTLLDSTGAIQSNYNLIGSQGTGIAPGQAPPYPLLYTNTNNSQNLIATSADLNNNTNGVVVFTSQDWPTTFPFFFPSPSPSDLWGSHARSLGRPMFFDPYEQQYRVGTEIAVSEPIADRGIVNGIGIFLPQNRQVFDRNTWGDITVVLVETSVCLVICDRDHFITRFNSSTVRTDGQGNLVAQNTLGMFMAPERKAGTNYGCGMFEINTIRKYAGIVRWLDISGYVVLHNFSVADSNTDEAGYLSYILQKIAQINIQNLDSDYPIDPLPVSYFIGGIDPKTSEYYLTMFTLPVSGSPSYINTQTKPTPAVNETLVFDLKTARLKGFSAFTPEYYGLMPTFFAQREFFSFKQGVPFVHHNNYNNFFFATPPPYANFYGTQTECRITVVCNLDAEKVKRFFWIEVYCRQSLDTGVAGVAPQPIMYMDIATTEKGQQSRLLPLRWSQRDGFWCAEFLCDLLTPTDPNLPLSTGVNALFDGNNLQGRWLSVSLVTQSAFAGQYFEISNVAIYGDGVSKSDGS